MRFWIVAIIVFIAALTMPIQVTGDKMEELTQDTIADLSEEDTLKLMRLVTQSVSTIGAMALDEETRRYEQNDDLGFLDGLKNGVLVIGAYFKNIFLRSVVEGMLEESLGVFFIGLIKNFFLCIFSSIVFAFKILMQEASVTYYLGYLCAAFGIMTTAFVKLEV